MITREVHNLGAQTHGQPGCWSIDKLSIMLLIMSIAARRGGWITTSILGFNGVSFINHTQGAGFYNQNVSSLLMSAGFLLAAIAYVIAISALRRE
jgi:hypothetical protein